VSNSKRRPNADQRHNSGGYDFGGYVPGADYQPRKKNFNWKTVVAIVVVAGLVGAYALILF